MQPSSTTNPMPHPPTRAGSLQSLRRRRRAWAREDGQALVELAFVLPILLLLVFGIVRFGLALNSANDETHLANEVARYATVNENPSCAECKTGLAAWGKGQGDSAALREKGKVCIKFPEDPATKTSGQLGDPVEVVIERPFNWLPVLKAGPSIVRKAVMRLEAVPTHYGKECA
jgi:hypothetical protein